MLKSRIPGVPLHPPGFSIQMQRNDPLTSDRDEFDWSADADSVVVQQQNAIAIYLNPRNEIVIRQTQDGGDDDVCVVFHKSAIDRIVEAIRATALLDAIGHQGQRDESTTGGTATIDTRSERREGEPQGDREP